MLSVVVLTLNEAERIAACLDSARSFADELVVFDSHSADATIAIARTAGARVHQRRFDNYPAQRNAALDAAEGEWVFFLDADERAEARVGQEIGAAIAAADSEPAPLALGWSPRKNFIFGKWIRHTGWSPDYQPRLLRKGRAYFDPARLVHERVIADGREIYFQEPLTHFNYDSLKQFRAKQVAYTRFEAEVMFRQGLRPRRRGLFTQPLREFYRRLVTLQGYQDGAHGLALSGLMAYYAFVRQQRLREMWSEERSK